METIYQTVSERFDPIKVAKSKKSITVPDMSFTPREIIAKFSRGEKVPLGFKGLYDSNDDDPSQDPYYDDPSIFEDDPTRDPEFDFGDYVEEKHALEERQKEAKRRSKVKKDLESEREASSERVSASDQATSETTSGEAKPSPAAQP